MHSGEVAEAIGAAALPVDPNRRADMGHRVPMAREALRQVEHRGLWRPPAVVARLLEQAKRLPPTRQPVTVTHGDLHFRHLLVRDGRASGVIDWIDLCRADPAIDLQLVWSFLPPSGRVAFLDAYGQVSEEQLLRARVLALFLCAVLARYAHEQGAMSIQREAIAGLERAVRG